MIDDDGREICIGNESEMDGFASIGAKVKFHLGVLKAQTPLARNPLTNVDHEATYISFPRKNIASGILAYLFLSTNCLEFPEPGIGNTRWAMTMVPRPNAVKRDDNLGLVFHPYHTANLTVAYG